MQSRRDSSLSTTSSLSNQNSNTRRESVGRLNPRSTSLSGPAPSKTVSVAVLPPHLNSPQRTGLPNYDEGRHRTQAAPPTSPNQQQQQQQPKRGFFKRALSSSSSLSTTTAASSMPPFVMKEVEYEVWRKHYAKDAAGNYRGLSAPAEDCLLLPGDVERWRLKEDDGERGGEVDGRGATTSWAQRFTRGKEALPTYDEGVEGEGAVPGYEEADGRGHGLRGQGAAGLPGYEQGGNGCGLLDSGEVKRETDAGRAGRDT